MDWFTALARPSLTDDDEDDKQEVASTVNPDVAASVGTIPPSLPDSDNTDDPPAKNDPPVPRRAKAPPSLEAKPLSGLGVVMGESGVTTPTTTLYPPAPEETPSEIPGSTPGGATPPSASDRLAAALDAYRKQRGSLDDVSWIARAAEGGAAGFAKRKTDNSIGDRIHGMYKDALQRPLDDAAADEKVNALRDSENRDASVRAAFPDAARMFGDRAKADDVIGWLKTRAGLDATDALTRKNLREPAVDPLSDRKGRLLDEKVETERARQEELRRRGLGGTTGGPKPMQERNLDLRVADLRQRREVDLGKVLEAYNDPLSIIQEVETAFPGITTGKVDAATYPSTGAMMAARVRPFGLDVGSQIAPDRAVTLRTFQDRLEALVGKKDSGLVLSVPELARLKAFLGSGAGAKPEQFQDAVQILLRGMHRGLTERTAPYRGTGDLAVYDDFMKKSPDAITPDHPLFAGVRKSSATSPATPSGALPEDVNLDGLSNLKANVPAPPPRSTPTEGEVRIKGGKKYRRVAGGWEEVQ